MSSDLEHLSEVLKQLRDPEGVPPNAVLSALAMLEDVYGPSENLKGELIEKRYPKAVWSVGKPVQMKKKKSKYPPRRYEAYISSNDRIGEESFFSVHEDGTDETMALVTSMIAMVVKELTLEEERERLKASKKKP